MVWDVNIRGVYVTYQEALEIANEIEDSDEKIFTLKFIAGSQERAGDIEGAKVTFQLAITVVEKIEKSL